MIEKINVSELAEESLQSPSGKYGASVKDVSSALETEGQPFEVEWVRLPPGRTNFPCHAHQVQWEFYLVVRRPRHRAPQRRQLRGGRRGRLRAAARNRAPDPQPSETEDLVYYVIADNPASDPVYYPDSDKWLIRPPGKLGRMTEAEYFDGEE